MVAQLRGRGLAIIAIFSTAAGIAIIVSGLRVYVRLRLIKRQCTRYEDSFTGVGLLLFMFTTGLAIARVFYGTGQHISLISRQDQVMALKV